MKKSLNLTVFVIAAFALFTACEETTDNTTTPDAVACFNYSPNTELTAGTEITFTNCSENATNFAWNFGDGSTSTDENPVHTFETAGEYQVQLVAANETSADTVSKIIFVESDVNQPTENFIYDKQTETYYQLETGYSVADLMEGTQPYYYVTLYSQNVSWDQSHLNPVEGFAGQGNVVVLYLEQDESIEVGIYTVNEELDDDWSYVAFDRDFDNLTWEDCDDNYIYADNIEAVSGQLEIKSINPTVIKFTNDRFIVEFGDQSIDNSSEGQVTDYDGNVYETVEIGDQIWMAENLKTTHYADGTLLIDGTGITGDFSDDYTSKYFFWYNDNVSNRDIYGALYTWAAAMNGVGSSNTNPSNVQGVCPDGWHLPSDAEWTQLTDYLGGTEIAGGKMKATGTNYWWSPNEGATNESGFSGLPGGNRGPSGSMDEALGENGKFWSTTKTEPGRAMNRRLMYGNAEVDEDSDPMDNGLSVRCVKN